MLMAVAEEKTLPFFRFCSLFMRGLVIPASRKTTSAPGIRPTGSLRIALGERCFREPSLQAALVRLTFQCMVGS